MSATIFYFSGTGNSYTIAKKISERLPGRLVPITSIIGEDNIMADADSIGIVFPVYYTDVPNIIRVFLSKLRGLSLKYFFAVCSFGGGTGRSIKTVKELLSKNGGELSAAYGVHMPQNAFLKPWVKNDRLLAKIDAEVERICRKTEKKARSLPSKRILDVLLAPIGPIFKSATRNYMLKTVGGSEEDSDMSLIYRLDCVFSVSEECNGCGICSKVCPAGNIVVKNGRPEWNHKCENCLACYNFCPKNAISGIAQKDYYYLNPGYTVKLAQKQSGAAE
jgi:ferredoxin/flavodoxin